MHFKTFEDFQRWVKENPSTEDQDYTFDELE